MALLVSFLLNVFLFVKVLKGGDNMVDMYVALCIAGRRNIDTVPAKFQQGVLADLNAIGLDGHGQPLSSA